VRFALPATRVCVCVCVWGGVIVSHCAGSNAAVLELGEPRKEWLSMSGFSSWVAWRSAYLTRLGTIKNRLYVVVNWTTTLLFGRDISRW
jgi:NADH:ubiquinone reductase (non-electrogenic)